MPASERSARFMVSLVIPLLLAVSAPLLPGEGAASPRDRAMWASSSMGLPTTGNYYGITFADINKDGKVDLVAAPDGTGVKVYLGDGTGCWTAMSPQPPATAGSDVRVGDVDKDGNPDIVSGSASNQNGVHIYRGNGAGIFTEITAGSGLPTTGNWRGIALGDVNNDGNLDIATTNGYSGSLGIKVYTGDGTGKFTSNSTGLPATGDRDSGTVLADFNNDGNLDIAAGGFPGVVCYLGNGGAGGFVSWTNSSTGLPPNRFTGVNATDANNDGLMDIVLSSYGDGLGVRVYRNNNNASSWSSNSTGLPSNGHYIDVSSGDFDSDGNIDLISGRVSGSGIHCYYGNGAGSWTENSTGLCMTDTYIGNDVADFNNDGSPDFAIASYSNKGILAYRNMHAAPPAPSLVLTEPLGNVSWSGGSIHPIRWNASLGTPAYNISLSYSTDSGGNFGNIIISGLVQTVSGSNEFGWSVPEIDSTGVRVRVGMRDFLNQTLSRTSPYDLGIDSAHPGIASTVPSNGAQGVSNTTPVRLRFSEQMNRSSAESAVSILGPGSPALLAPTWSGNELVFQTSGMMMESLYSVTVSEAARDDSDPGNSMSGPYSFTFNTSNTPVPTIALTAPSGGEVWLAGSQQKIIWTAAGGTGPLTIDISFSTQGPDGPWTEMASNVTNDGSHDWMVPDIASSDCFVLIGITDSGSPRKNGSDKNDAPFEIKEAAIPLKVNLTAPAGGEVWLTGSRQNITWNATGGNGIKTVTLQYSVRGAGGPWNQIISGGNDTGRLAWSVPNTPSVECLVRVTATDGYDPPQSISATNQLAFGIKEAAAPLSVNLTSPSGGENWTVLTRHTITWSTAGGNGARTVLLQYSLDGTAGPWRDIVANETDDGSFDWTVPNATSVSILVRVTVKDNYEPPQLSADICRNPFIISRPAPPVDTVGPSVRIEYPQDGALLKNGTLAIRATASDNVAVIRMEILMDGRMVASSTGPACTYDWNGTSADIGGHNLTAMAYDTAGNRGSASVNFTVHKPAVDPPAGQQSRVDSTWWIPAIVVISVVIVIAVLATAFMRRRPQGPAPQYAPPR